MGLFSKKKKTTKDKKPPSDNVTIKPHESHTHTKKDKHNKSDKSEKQSTHVSTNKIKTKNKSISPVIVLPRPRYHSNKCDICAKRTLDTFSSMANSAASSTTMTNTRDKDGHLVWHVVSLFN